VEKYDEIPDGSDVEDLSDRVDELEQRIEDLSTDRSDGDAIGGAIAYLTGSSLAIMLSWSRNASILWCMLHGVTSWIYVLYFAFTR